MTSASLGPALEILIGLAVGGVLGVVHFGSLLWVARRFADGGAALALTVQLARFAVLGGVLFGLSKMGAPALLAGAVGLLVARYVVVRRLGGMPWARR
mgnify:CR=1 FL=1